MSFSIAIIDQGVESFHDRLKGAKISGVTLHKNKNGYEVTENVYGDDTGHGTAVASIIYKMVPELPLYVVKLSSFDKRLSEDLLTNAIKHCLLVHGISIINISMGIPTESPSQNLINICREARERNVQIVAASYNFPNTSCYPAHLPTIYGVSTGLVKDKFEYGVCSGPINILAKGTTQRVAFLGNSYKIASGTSFATAHFSAILGRMMMEHPTINASALEEKVMQFSKRDVQELLYFRNDSKTKVHKTSKSEFEEEGRKLFSPFEGIKYAGNIALYPVSEKEMNTLLEFSDNVILPIKCLIDYPVRLISRQKIEKPTIGLEVIRNLDKIDFSSFDTLVCGYFLDQLSDANIEFSIRLIKKCIGLNKNFICWDVDAYNLIVKFINQQGSSCTSQIYVTKITADNYTSIKEYANLPYLRTPVIGIVGTSNKQGKITAQMRVRKILEIAGYKVSLVGTEPQTLIMGADFVFPYGYKCPIEPPESEWGRLLRIALRGVQRYHKPDVILTGTQGALLPRNKSISNEIGHDLSSLHFLLGVQPDAICCAINPMDSPEIIRQTIEVIKSYCKSHLLLCFMTPWKRTIRANESGQNGILHAEYLTEEEAKAKRVQFQEELEIPVLDIMDYEADNYILSIIQQAFSSEMSTT
jgi:uncharacterized NAD-dependent epimerase/dehydratase family protein